MQTCPISISVKFGKEYYKYIEWVCYFYSVFLQLQSRLEITADVYIVFLIKLEGMSESKEVCHCFQFYRSMLPLSLLQLHTYVLAAHT